MTEKLGRGMGILLGLLAMLIVAAPRSARAQYQAIPNYVGAFAGKQFRGAVNDRLSGVVPIAPTIVKYPFANLPAEQDGALYYCTDCVAATPCAAGGTGAFARGVGGAWSCSSGAGALAAANLPHLRQTVNATVNSADFTLPNAPTPGDVLVAAIFGYYDADTFVTPSGQTWTQITTCNTGNPTNGAFFYHTVQTGETASYDFTVDLNGNPAAFQAGSLVELYNVGALDAQSACGGPQSGQSSFTLPALTTTAPGDYVLGLSAFQSGSAAVVITSVAAPAQVLLQQSGEVTGGTPGGVITGYSLSAAGVAPAIALGANVNANSWIALQVAFKNTGTPVTGAALVAGQSGAVVQDLSASVNGALNVKAAPYNAAGNGSQCDDGAINAAIAAACTMSPHPPVILPPGYYLACAPILVGCSYLSLGGLPGSEGPGTAAAPADIETNYSGPAIIVEGTNTNNFVLHAPLVGSVGHSIDCTASTTCNQTWLAPSEDAGLSLNGDQNLTAEGFFTLLGTPDQFALVSATGSLTGHADSFEQVDTGLGSPLASPKNNALVIGGTGGSTPKAYAEVSVAQDGATTGTEYGLTGVTTITESAVHHEAVTFAGATGLISLYLDGKLEAQTTVSGCTSSAPCSIIEDPFEDIAVPGLEISEWPGAFNGTAIDGYEGSVEVSNTVRYTNCGTVGCTAYTVPTSKFSADVNTQLLENWENFGSNYVGANVNSSQSYPNAWLPVRGNTEGNNAAIDTLHDLTSGSIIAIWSVFSHYDNLTVNGTFNLYENDFESYVHNVFISNNGGTVGLIDGAASNDNYFDDVTVDGPKVGFVQAPGSFVFNFPRFTDRGATVIPFVVEQGGGEINRLYTDIESAVPSFLTDLLTVSGFAPTQCNSCELDMPGGSTGSVVTFDGGAPPGFFDSTFNDSNAASEIFDLIETPSFGAIRVVDPSLMNQVIAPLTNSGMAQYVHVDGIGWTDTKYGGGFKAVALGTPATPTCSPVGTVGSTSYSYYIAYEDIAGDKTPPSAVCTVTNGNATLSSSNYDTVSWTSVPNGTQCVDVLKTNTSTLLAQVCGYQTAGNEAMGVPLSFNDTGQTTKAYTAATTDQTGTISAAAVSITGALSAGSITNSCAGTVTLASGAGTFTNACITGSRPVVCTDETNADAVKCAPSAGSVAIAGNASDVISVAQF